MEALSRPSLVGLTLSFFAFAFLLPLWRMKRARGQTGYVAHLAASPLQRFSVGTLKAVVLGYALWLGLALCVPFRSLGVWRVHEGVLWLGVALGAAGLLLVAAAQVTMGASWRIGIDTRTRTALVTSGAFRWVRNPIFSGVLLYGGALILLAPSPWTLLGFGHLLFALGLQVRLEEEHLRRLHPEVYPAYAQRVGRFLPGVGRLHSP